MKSTTSRFRLVMVQAKVQDLKREFEIISMKRNEKVDDYSNQFA